MRKYTSILLISIFLLSKCAFAVSQAVINYNQLHNTNVISLGNEAPQGLNYRISSAKLIFQLDLKYNNDGIYRYHDNPFTFHTKIRCSSIGGDDIDISLDIDNTKPEVQYILNLTDLQYDNVNFNLSQLEESNTGFSISNDLELIIKYEIVYGIDTKLKLTNEFPKCSIKNVDISGKRITISWDNPFNVTFPNYQLQVLKLSNYSELYADDPEVISTKLTVDDWSKAFNILTESSQPEYSLTLIEGEGFYVCRVRPVGTFYEGGSGNHNNWSEEQWSDIDYVENEIILSNDKLAYPYFYFSEDPDKLLNWIYSKTFTEGNRNISEMIVYANGLNQVQQTQKYLPSIDKNIITQNIYDYVGRPALSTMPVPIEGEITGYKTSFVTTMDGDLYTSQSFDSDINYLNPEKVSEAGSYQYFSTLNQSENQVPSAEGYPFTRTIYTSDGTGRTKESTTPGYNNSLHSTEYLERRTIRTFYCKPSELELIRIFGAEAPSTSSVNKVITLDQNNSMSIQYLDQNEKILASCLSKNNFPIQNSQLNDLSIDVPVEEPITDKVKSNIKTQNGFISTHKIFIDQENSALKLSYVYNCEKVPFECGYLNIDCGFDVKISVFSIEDNHYVLEKECGIVECGRPVEIEPLENLPVGEYIITKEIRYNEESVSSNYIVSAEHSINPLLNWITDRLKHVGTDEESQKYFYEQILEVSSIINTCKPASNPPVPACDDLLPYGFTQDFMLSSQHSMDLYNSQGIIIDASYLETMNTNDEILEIRIKSDCCNEISIPCIFEGKYKCDSGDPRFEEYLIDIIPAGHSITEFFPQYVAGEFNAMIKEMLNNSYDIYDGKGQHIQYDCDNLWNAWVLITSAYSRFSINGLNNKSATAHDIDDENGGTSTFDDHFNNESHFRGVFGWLLKWLVDQELSTTARTATSTPGHIPTYSVNLWQQFLETVGYKFTLPIMYDENDNLVHGPDPGDQYNIPLNAKPYIIGIGSNEVPHEYIKDRVFAFKYFEYHTSINYSQKKKACLVLNCYEDYSQTEFCQPVPDCTGKEFLHWNQNNIASFFNCITTLEAPDNSTQTIGPCPDRLGLAAIAIASRNECKANFDSKYGEYRHYIEDVFRQNCYEIDGCETNSNSISSKALDQLAQFAINNSKTYYCEQLLNTEVTCKEVVCTDLYTGITVKQYPKMTMPDCDLMALQVSEWFLEIGVPSMCNESSGNKLCEVGDTKPTVERDCGNPAVNLEDIKFTQLRNISIKVVNGIVTIN